MSSKTPNTEQFGYQGLVEIYQSSKQALWRKVFEIPTVKNLLQTVQPNTRVLDMGCGAGFYLPDILASTPAEVEGIDICEDQIIAAKGSFSNQKKVTFKVADARYYRPNLKFDFVTGFWLLNYARTLEDLEDFFVSIASSLVTDGWFLGLNDNPFNSLDYYLRYSPYGFLKQCQTPRVGGSKIVWQFKTPQPLDITTYWWSPQTYRQAASQAGLALEFLYPESAIDEDSSEPGFWDFLIANPPFIAIKARKVNQN